jgi:hypothetical protein
LTLSESLAAASSLSEHTGAVISQCGRSSNIILIFDPDNVRQSETVPSESVSNESISRVFVEKDLALNIASYRLT